MTPAHSHRLWDQMKVFWMHHGVAMTVLIGLTIAALGSRVLVASLITDDPDSGGTFTLPEQQFPYDTAQACSYKNTMFDPDKDGSMRNLESVIDKYDETLETILDNYEKELAEAPDGYCQSESFEEGAIASYQLENIASDLPGWDNKPVTFSSLGPLLAEFQRVYECRLDDFDRYATGVIVDGYDEIPEQPAKSYAEVFRIADISSRVLRERQRSRVILERTMNMFRSLSMTAPIAYEMRCLQKQSADLRIGMTLLADTVSCMPKVWDISTSVHDFSSLPRDYIREQNNTNTTGGENGQTGQGGGNNGVGGIGGTSTL